jgi:hypothetical protein
MDSTFVYSEDVWEAYGLLRGHDSDDVFRRYLGSEEAVVDWECGIGVRVGARWRAAVSH